MSSGPSNISVGDNEGEGEGAGGVLGAGLPSELDGANVGSGSFKNVSSVISCSWELQLQRSSEHTTKNKTLAKLFFIFCVELDQLDIYFPYSTPLSLLFAIGSFQSEERTGWVLVGDSISQGQSDEDVFFSQEIFEKSSMLAVPPEKWHRN